MARALNLTNLTQHERDLPLVYSGQTPLSVCLFRCLTLLCICGSMYIARNDSPLSVKASEGSPKSMALTTSNIKSISIVSHLVDCDILADFTSAFLCDRLLKIRKPTTIP